MPRQLPWLNKGGGNRTQLKQPPRPAKKQRIQSDIDDDFFEGTVLESSRKGKERANSRESDEDLPSLPTTSTHVSRKGKEPARSSRLPSSSPPPAAELPPPKIEYMRKGVDNFDLRDDEFMMVEDELLQTAKLFTQHLHLQEYERLKTKIEEQRKEIASRPIVPTAKPSTEAHFKTKAKEQAKAQKKAIREVFSAARDDSDNDLVTLKDASSSKASVSRYAGTTAADQLARSHQPAAQSFNASDPDSDDLDAPRRQTRVPDTTKPNSTSRPLSKGTLTSFAKPALTAGTRPRASRINRPTPFDMWDDFTPNCPSSPTKMADAKPLARAHSPTKTMLLSTPRSSSPTKASQSSTSKASQSSPTKRPGRSINLFDDFDIPKREPLSKESSDRLAKRKADKEKVEKRKSSKLDDTIPTFLF